MTRAYAGRMNIAVLGSFNMDFVMRSARLPRRGETVQGEFAMHLGGKGFNQAIAARRLGAEVEVIGRVGDDTFGHQFLAALDAAGIGRAGVASDPDGGTGIASIVIEDDGANTVIQAPRANRRLAPDDIARAAASFDGAAIAMLQLETSMPAALAFSQAARAAGALVLLNPAPAAAVPDDLLRAADIIVPNEIEAETLTGISIDSIDAAEAAARALLARGPRAAVVTLGARGAIGVTADERYHEPAPRVDAIDTVGAGDAFCAAIALRLAGGAPLREALAFAVAAGAVATTRHGAEPSMPHLHDVEATLAKGVTP